jgi:hypothetical protein
MVSSYVTFVSSNTLLRALIVSHANLLVASLESAAFGKEETKLHVEYIGSDANSTQPSRSIGLRASEANFRRGIDQTFIFPIEGRKIDILIKHQHEQRIKPFIGREITVTVS